MVAAATRDASTADLAPAAEDVRAAAVEAIRRDIGGFRWTWRETGGIGELTLPHHHPIRFDLAGPTAKWVAKKHGHGAMYEPATAFILSELIRRCGVTTFFDVGAANGYFSLVAASAEVAPPVTAHAFEMRPDSIAQMEAAKRDNPDLPGGLRPRHQALSDKSSGRMPIWFYKTKLFLAEPAPADYREPVGRRLRAMLFGQRDGAELKKAEVEVVALDDVVSREGLVPDLLKIDVDGFEAKVLAGLASTLKAHKPMLLLEIHRDHMLAPFGVTRREIVASLIGLGYRGLLVRGHRDLAAVTLADIDAAALSALDTGSTDLMLFV